MALTFLGLVEKVLNESDKPMSSMQIWDDAVLKGYNKLLSPVDSNRGARLTPWSTVSTQIFINIKEEDTVFIKTSRGYFWVKERVELLDLEESEIEARADEVEKEYDKSTGKVNVLEASLHKPLGEYLRVRRNMFARTINANASKKSKKGGMRWGAPDMLGVVFTSYKNSTLRTLFSKLYIPTVKLVAFELKRELNMANLVSSFFQAVSNASWANEGWLVAKEMSEDPDFKLELQRLNQAFKVGILQLNYDDPENSVVIFPAIRRSDLDLETMNKLIQNKDIEIFLGDINSVLESSTREKAITSYFGNDLK